MDLHNSKQRLQNAETLVKVSTIICKTDKKTILDYETKLLAEGKSFFRIEKQLRILRLTFEQIELPIEEVTPDDLIRFFAKINRDCKSSWTLRDYHIILRSFFRWQNRPDLVDWIKPQKGKSKVPALLSKEEIDTIIAYAPTPMDRALIAGLYDSGTRIGEWASVEIGDFTFEKRIENDYIEVRKGTFELHETIVKSAFVNVFGKTGSRTIELKASSQYILEWLKVHPKNKDYRASMWVDKNGQPAFDSYDALMYHIRKLVQRGGIDKHVVGYSFRHSRMTELERSLAETYLKKRHGTTQLNTYIHPKKGRQAFK